MGITPVCAPNTPTGGSASTLATTSNGKKRASTTNYIDNDEFEELIRMHRASGSDDVLQRIICDFFYVLAYHIIVSAHFNMIDEEDAMQDAVMACFRKMQKFDPERGKAFNFFTTVIFNQMRGMFKTSKSYYQLKRSFLRHQAMRLDSGNPQAQRLILYMRDRGYFDDDNEELASRVTNHHAR